MIIQKLIQPVLNNCTLYFKKIERKIINPDNLSFSKKLIICILQIVFLVSTYGGVFLSFGKLNEVKALDTSGYSDCGGSSYNYEYICYIRGIYQPLSGTDPTTGCSLTNRIVYNSPSFTYRFCDQANTAALTNQEVIAFVNWHAGGWFNILSNGNPTLAEVFNQIPNQPTMHRPQSGWEMGPRNNGAYTGVSCSTTSNGQGCNVEFVTQSYDPDFYQWVRIESEIFRNQGGNRNYNATLYSNDQVYASTQNLNDGNWNFRSRNCDTTNECSGFTSSRTFLVDTTSPTGIAMNPEPLFTNGSQNTISATVGSDNLVGGIEYMFQVDENADFSSPFSSSGWITSTQYTFSGLSDDTQYFYRVRGRDRLYNTTNWSSSVNSIQDNTPPLLQNFTIDNTIISPQNSDGQFDNITISFEWIEKHPLEARFEILDSSNTVIKTYTSDITSQTLYPLPITQNFTWDGRNNANNLVADGGYTGKISVRDKATNTSSGSMQTPVIEDSFIIIVDNFPADINVSTPVTGSWFNYQNITINGQTEPLATAQITNNQTSSQSNLNIDPDLGTFDHNDTVEYGANTFTLDVSDLAQNTNQKQINYFREEANPSIDSITPENLINNKRPEITLNLSDTGYNDGINNYISGIDVNSVYIALNHPDLGSEFALVNNGVNVQPTLGNIQENCSQIGAFGNSASPSCTYKFVFTSDLNPDGEYEIITRVKDKAGNNATNKTQNFELDSNIQSDVSTPTNGSLFNYSQISLSGSAEKHSEITLSLPLGDIDNDGNVDSEVFIVSDSASNNSRVSISNCRNSSNPTNDGIVEICDFEINNFQLEKDDINPGNIVNQIQIDTKDNVDIYSSTGLNTKSEIISVNVDLFAVTLTLNSDSQYFSPNGDGVQDGVNFIDIATNGQIETYTLEIKDNNGNVVKSFSASGTPPAGIPWDGRVDSSIGTGFVTDGTYNYSLKVTTTDGIEFSTTPVEIFAVTSLANTVVITSPKTDTFSSRGLINVIGQAPQSLVNSQDSNLQIRICIDTISISTPQVGQTGSCDSEFYTTVDSNNLFSRIVILPRVNAQDEHFITATAFDKYGNETEQSNSVKIITTINPPFESVEIIPILTGTNDPQAYQSIIDKLDLGEEVTQADIDALRSVIMRSTVFQGTERVRLFFADHSQVNTLPETTSWDSIGYISGDNQTKLYQEFVDGTNPFTICNATTCTWDFMYPVPPNLKGLYEIRFEGKLDQEVENFTAGFTVDGNIPSSPIILDINKKLNSNFVDTNLHSGIYYSNSEVLQIRGASDPNADIEIQDDFGNVICTTVSSPVGIFTCEVDVSTLPQYSNPDTTVYNIPLVTFATLGLNTSQSIDTKTVVIDKLAPEIQSVDTQSQWKKSGSLVDFSISANETLGYAINIDKQNPLEVDQCINSYSNFQIFGIDIPIQMAAHYDMIVNSADPTKAQGAFVISGNAIEGRYCTTIKVSDLAGNSVTQTQTFFIDNTIPNIPTIDTTDWGKFNGIKTQPEFVAKGRLVPEFVHEEGQIKIKTWSEENTNLEFFVNSNLITQNSLLTTDCKEFLEEDKIADTVNIQDKDICLHTFTYPLTQHGKDYVFQVIAIDRAGNKSIISEDEVVYYDNQNPINPEVLSTNTQSYNQTPGWQKGNTSSISKDINVNFRTHAESLSDLEYTITGPQSFNNYIFTQTPGNQVKDQSISLGTQSDDRDGCVEVINTRRTGACQDGNYSVSIKSTDAAGNASGVAQHVVERDTVRPGKPSVKLIDYISYEQLNMEVIGENNTSVKVDYYRNGSYLLTKTFNKSTEKIIIDGLVKNWWWNTTYEFKVSLLDKAMNESEVIKLEYTTPMEGIGGFNGTEIFVGIGTKGDEYAGKTVNDLQKFDNALFRAYVSVDYNGDVKLTNLKVASTVITYTSTDENGTVNIYTVGPNKGMSGKVNINKENYDWPRHDEVDYNCWGSNWFERNWNKLSGINRDKHDQCVRNELVTFENIEIDATISDAWQANYKIGNNKNSSTQCSATGKFISLNCDSNIIKEAWQNYSLDGRKQQTYSSGELYPGDLVYSVGWYQFKFNFNNKDHYFDTKSTQDHITLPPPNQDVLDQYAINYLNSLLGLDGFSEPSNVARINRRPIFRPSTYPLPSDKIIVNQSYYCTNCKSHSGTPAVDLKTINIQKDGKTPTYATMDGVAENIGWWGGYTIVVRNKEYEIYYLHLDPVQTDKVFGKKGTKKDVQIGDTIGVTNNTSGPYGFSTGAHLHYEINVYDKVTQKYRFATKAEMDNLWPPK